MSVPGPPELPVDPESFDQTLEFYWEPPLNNGGCNITNYRIKLCNTDTGAILSDTERYFTTGPTLTNGTTYYATIEACNAMGFGEPAYFRPYQPGSPPNPPSTISTSILGTCNVIVSWTPPTTAPDATIFWYSLYCRYSNAPADNNLFEVTADGLTQSSYLLSNLNITCNYAFELAAVNCPGWSESISTSMTFNPPDYFVPTDITGLQVWLDGNDTTTMTFSGSNVTQWNDKSGFNRNATKTFSGNPGYNSTILGIGGLFFNGETTAMRSIVPAQTFPNYITIFCVLQKTGAVIDLEDPVSRTDGYPARPVGMFANTRNINLATTNSPLDFRFATSPLIYNLGARSNSWSEWSNAIQIMTNQGFGVDATYNDASSNFNIGSRAAGGTGGFRGNIGEVFAYNYELPTFYRQQTEGYLAWKWGLQSNLPATHPYRNTRPINPGLISPYEAPNLSFWLDATRISTISSGTALTSWTDSTSNAYVGTASNFAGCNKPIYQSSFLNGYMPAVTFSSNAGNYFNYGNILDIRTSSISIFAVLQNSNTEAGLIGKNRSGGINYRWSLNNSLTGNGYGMWFYAQGTGFFNAGVAGNAMPATPIMLNANWNRNTISLFSNGGSISSNAAVDTTSDFINSGLYTFVGANQDSTGQNPASGTYMNGGVGEILVFMSSPIQSTRQKIEGYLSWKWGLTQNLPNQHPYKFYPPLSNYSSIAINTTQVFATNFNDGNDAGFVNFSNSQLISSPDATITGTGSAYNTSNGSSTSLYPSITFTPVTTNSGTMCASVYLRTNATNRSIMTNLSCGITTGGANNRLIYQWNGLSYDFNTGANIPLNTWTHVAATISPTNVTLYLNGSNVFTSNVTHNSITTNYMTIGATSNSPTFSFFPGYIDNVRFYTSTLTSNEIQAIYYNTQFI